MDSALAAAAPPGHPIDLLCVDLMFTVLELAGGVSPREFKANLYRFFGRLPEDEDQVGTLDMTDDQIHDLIDLQRERFKEIRTDQDFWEICNKYFFEAALVNDARRHQHADKYGRRVRKALLEGRKAYTVRPSMIDLLRCVRSKGVRVVILSNQIDDVARDHVVKFEIEDAFDAVYTSEEIGVMKPHADAWKIVLQRESEFVGREIRPERVAHLGNSANSDTGAARLGIPVMLYDRFGTLARLGAGDLAGVSIPQLNARDLHRWWEQGLITVHPTIASMRDLLKARTALRATAATA